MNWLKGRELLYTSRGLVDQMYKRNREVLGLAVVFSVTDLYTELWVSLLDFRRAWNELA